ncbi:MAG: IS110 family transposase [Halobacteriovoraceae bacterium]|nr:IS110 family transposase [Halobacteriovoraceae bacterium]
MDRIYCGIDFHKNTSTICALKQDGQQVEMVTIRTANLVNYLSNRQNYLIGIEASGGTNAMVQKLKDSGHEVKIINPNKLKAIGLGGKKTDKRDAHTIAEVLRLNYIPEVYHKSEYARKIKSLLVIREQIVRTRVNLTNHVRGILREYGITMPQGMDNFFNYIGESLEGLDCHHIREALSFMLKQIRGLIEEEKANEQRLQSFSKEDKRVKQLQTIPGVGLMTSMALIAVVDDENRFTSSKYFASYLGLVPREYSSGEKRRMGSITRSGSEIPRRYLIHGARSVLLHTTKNRQQKDGNRRWALAVKNRLGMNKASVALAHRMARIAFNMLKYKQDYQQTPFVKRSEDSFSEAA